MREVLETEAHGIALHQFKQEEGQERQIGASGGEH